MNNSKYLSAPQFLTSAFPTILFLVLGLLSCALKNLSEEPKKLQNTTIEMKGKHEFPIAGDVNGLIMVRLPLEIDGKSDSALFIVDSGSGANLFPQSL